MTENEEQMMNVLKTFVEGALVEHDAQKSLSVIANDVIGIGMGNQGIVQNKADLIRILANEKVDADNTTTVVSYENIQIRCYEERYGTICCVLKISTSTEGKTVESSLGQIISAHKANGQWLIYALQATPLFNEIEEMEAYPIKFAENALERYREQEQIAKDAQRDSIAIYRVNFTEGCFENAIVKNDLVIRIEPGEQYEKAMFQSAWKYLHEEERYEFISKFSVGNIFKIYQSGQTELSMEYKMVLTNKESIWLRTIIRLYLDKSDGELKGYLYVIDIDKEKKKELMLQKKAECDLLTELYNKKYAELKISEKLQEISQTNLGAFFMIDLDHFKNINDTYGHKEGDRIIRESALVIKSLIRKNDIAGRLGGDEFCIFFHGKLTEAVIMEKAEHLCRGIRNIFLNQEKGVSCSIGIVFCFAPDLRFSEIYQNADVALYEQKRKGRNGYTIYRK